MFELPTYFILPLSGINYKDFGKLNETTYNLKTTKIDLVNMVLHCEVHLYTRVLIKTVENKYYLGEGPSPEILLFAIPTTVSKTIQMFIEGKYSKIPQNIKSFIKKYSGLAPDHDYILALDKNIKLKERMEEELEVSISNKAELLEKPKQEWFIEKEELV